MKLVECSLHRMFVVYAPPTTTPTPILSRQIDSTRTTLNLYTDASKGTLLRTVNAANRAPFVINADGFAYQFSDKGRPEVGVKSWGYRIVVSPIWRLQVSASWSPYHMSCKSTPARRLRSYLATAQGVPMFKTRLVYLFSVGSLYPLLCSGCVKSKCSAAPALSGACGS
jgi:hypothetical protein